MLILLHTDFAIAKALVPAPLLSLIYFLNDYLL